MTSCAIKALFKSFWDWRLMEFPEFATFAGEHCYDGKLQSYTLESIHNRKATVEKYLKDGLKLLSEPDIESDDKHNLVCFTVNLNYFLKGFSAKGHYFPLSYLDGVHIEFSRLLDAMKVDSEADYLKILERLSNLPHQILEIIQIMEEGIKHNMTFHSISVSGVLKQLDLLQVEPEKSLFYKPFASISEDNPVSFKSKDEILSKAKKVIKDDVLPSFQGLKLFLEKKYFKHLRPEIAISSLTEVNGIYQLFLDFHLSCKMTPEEVHEIGLKEVERIYKEMEKVIESLELQMSPKEFSDHLKEGTDFCFKNADELLEAYKGVVFNQIEPQLHKLFNYMPKSKLVIKTMPTSLPNAPGAYYYAGTPDGNKPGEFFINATDLRTLPKYEVTTLALHEAVPGHHLQSCFLIENENIPDFLRYLEDRRYTEAPSLFPLYTAYVEGWGLYSEYLGYELGLYDDAYLEYGHLSYEMLRACRLVVDTGIHAFGWTRDQAINYMLNHTAAHKIDIENEVNRYITWPGQACGYKIGELKIKALRKQAEETLGSKFDIRDFHDVILQSFGPLDLLEKNVLEYIAKCNF